MGLFRNWHPHDLTTRSLLDCHLAVSSTDMLLVKKLSGSYEVYNLNRMISKAGDRLLT